MFIYVQSPRCQIVEAALIFSLFWPTSIQITSRLTHLQTASARGWAEVMAAWLSAVLVTKSIVMSVYYCWCVHSLKVNILAGAQLYHCGRCLDYLIYYSVSLLELTICMLGWLGPTRNDKLGPWTVLLHFIAGWRFPVRLQTCDNILFEESLHWKAQHCGFEFSLQLRFITQLTTAAFSLLTFSFAQQLYCMSGEHLSHHLPLRL